MSSSDDFLPFTESKLLAMVKLEDLMELNIAGEEESDNDDDVQMAQPTVLTPPPPQVQPSLLKKKETNEQPLTEQIRHQHQLVDDFFKKIEMRERESEELNDPQPPHSKTTVNYIDPRRKYLHKVSE